MLTLDLLQRARRIVFVRLSAYEFLSIVALRNSIEVTWWVVGLGYPIQTHRVEQGAESLGLFDGYAWNIDRLIQWVRWHCPVCWNVLTSSRQTYDAKKCKQKAYRQRRKIMPERLYPKYTVTNIQTGAVVENTFVLKPDTDRHARIALLAYAASVDFENPLLATDIRNWMDEVSKTKPIHSFEGMRVGDIPDWLIAQSQHTESDNTLPK